MSKRLIIIERCEDCEHSAIGFETKTRHCGLSTGHIEDDCPEDGIPDWCPLPVLPERTRPNNHEGYSKLLAAYNQALCEGWNDCLNAIGGGHNG